MNSFNNIYGITADYARFCKFFVDSNHQLSPLEKLQEKQSISGCIADLIDRIEELKLDETEYRAELAHEFVDNIPLPCNKEALHRCACGFEELRKQQIHRDADDVRCCVENLQVLKRAMRQN